MEKTEENDIKPLFVYVITKEYAKPDDEQARVIIDMVLGQGDPAELGISAEEQAEILAGLPEDITGALLCSGFSLSNPGVLADLLEKDPCSRLVIATDEDTIVFNPDRTSEEYKALIPSLREACEKGLDSWSWARGLIGTLLADEQL